MELIRDYHQIRELTMVIKSYKEGFLTNFFIGESRCNLLINNELIYKIVFGKCAFILYKDHDFYHVYYQTTVKDELLEGLRQMMRLYPDETFVTDVVGMDVDTQQVSQLFELAGFNIYSKLLRMSRTKGIDNPQDLDVNVKYANLSQAKNIRVILESYFDKYTEQIPLLEEVIQLIENKRVLVRMENELIVGLVIFEITGLTSYLRYWFTHPAYRDRKIGSTMLRRFFYECRETKRQYFWVVASNHNAIIRYRHYGFEQERLLDIIMKK